MLEFYVLEIKFMKFWKFIICSDTKTYRKMQIKDNFVVLTIFFNSNSILHISIVLLLFFFSHTFPITWISIQIHIFTITPNQNVKEYANKYEKPRARV